MYTPAQLCDRLRDLGIDRSQRALTDWRDKKLLPALQSKGAGRGRGVRRFWSQDVLDQAIGADWLMTESDRADEALLGLWLSGYEIDPIEAQQAWIQHLKRVQHQRTKVASRFSGGYSGLWTRWWRKLQKNKAFEVIWWQKLPKEDQSVIHEFLGATQEWLRAADKRDGNDYRNHVSEMIVRFFNTDKNSSYKTVRLIWTLVDPTSVLAIEPSIETIESFSASELRKAQKSLTLVARALQHGLQLSSPLDDLNRVVLPIKLMRGLIGTLLAKLLIMTNRNGLKWPLEGSISALHSFVMRVQSTDIIKKKDDGLIFSDRARGEWKSTKKHLSMLWAATETTK